MDLGLNCRSVDWKEPQRWSNTSGKKHLSNSPHSAQNNHPHTHTHSRDDADDAGSRLSREDEEKGKLMWLWADAG